MMKIFIFKQLTIIIVFCLVATAQVIPTNEWVNFFSATTTFNGKSISFGSIVSVYDPDGVLCGSFSVHTEGQYGFLATYRDDSFTPETDEGAEPGDTLIFYINNHIALILGPGNPIWTSNGDVIELNLEGYSNYAPVITGFPDTLTFHADSTITLRLNDYVQDIDNPDSTLHWSVTGNHSVIVEIDDASNIAVLSAPLDWSGTEILIFTAMDDSSAYDCDTLVVHVTPFVGVKGEEVLQIPKDYFLSQNYPNPFNMQTTIKYGIPEQNYVCIRIYNLIGREIKTIVNEEQKAKYYKIIWDGKDQFGNKVSTGMYFYQIAARSKEKTFTKTKKLLLLQ